MSTCRCITGFVVKEGTTDPEIGVIVRLSTRKGQGRVQVADTKTDKKGHFSFDLQLLNDKGAWAGVFQLAVFAGTIALKATGDVRFSARKDARDLVVCVERPEHCAAPLKAPPADIVGDIATAGVHGVVQHVDGTGLVGLKAQLYRVGFNSVDPVGDPQTTLAEGWFSHGALGAGDYYVVVSVPGTPDRVVATSKVKFKHLSGAHRFEITVCDDALRGPSEFSRITHDISKAIAPTATVPAPGLAAALEALDIRQAVWLSARTEWSVETVVLRALAGRFATDMNGGSPTIPVLPEALYGLLRQGFPRTVNGILTRAPSAVGRAITLSRKANIIDRGISIETLRAGLKEALGRALADASSLDSLGAILGTSFALSLANGLDGDQIAELCGLYAGYIGTDEQFWADAADLSLISDPDDLYVNEAKRLVKIGMIAIGSAPCVTAILGTPGDLGTGEPSELAGWTSAEWAAVAAAVSPLPDGLDAVDPEADLARILKENAQLAYPAQALRSALTDVLDPLGVRAVLLANPTMDLRTHRIGAAEVTALGLTSPEATALRTAQRLSRIAPAVGSAAAMERLASRGLTSAKDVARRGTSRFISSYTAGDDSLHDEAVAVMASARSQHGMAVAFFGQAAPTLGLAALDFVGTDPAVDTLVNDTTVPGWDGLFTSPTGTRCARCQSIHGPSAYLVDLLHWLSARTDPADPASVDPATVIDALTARRPDLVQIPLTCENAERVLPYIDLTLECLEAAMTGTLGTAVYSSESETPELLAAPQYVNDEAYTILATAINTFTTPFHQPLAEARPFLAHLGIERTDLMRAFSADETDIAYEELQVVRPETGDDAITDNPIDEVDYWSIFVDAAPTVQELLRVTGMTYPQLLDLLHTRAANPESGVGKLAIIIADGADPYALTSYVIQQVTVEDPLTYGVPSTDQFAAFRKVIRLQRATGWTFLELDKVMAALAEPSPADWIAATLVHVGNVHRLARMTELEPTELAAWFGTMDTFADRDTADHPILSLYDQTFLNPSVFPRAELDEQGSVDTNHVFPFVLTDDRTAVNTADLSADVANGTTLTTHLSRLHAALGVDESEVSALTSALHTLLALDTTVDATELGVPGVTLANLTRLYRWCSLGRVLGVKPTQALRFAVLLGVAPSDDTPINEGLFTDVADTIDFIEQVRECQAAGWSIDELDYMLRHESADLVAPTDAYFNGILGRLHDAVAAQSESDETDARVDAVIRQLAQEFGSDRATFDALDGTMWIGSPSMAGVTGFGRFLTTDIVIDEDETTTTAAVEVILTVVTATLEGTIAASTHVTIPTGTVVGFGPVGLTSAPAGTPCSLAASTVTLSLPDLAGLSLPDGTIVTLPDTSTQTLSGAATASLASGARLPVTTDIAAVTFGSLFERFLRTEFVDTDTTSGTDVWAGITRASPTFGDDFAVMDALFKAVLLRAKLGANADERAAWVDRATSWDLLDPSLLWGDTLADRLTGTDGYTRLKHTIDLFAARTRLPGDTPSFADLIPVLASDATSAVADIAARTGWDAASLTALIPSAFGTVDAITLFLDRMDIVRKAGTSPDVVEGWAAVGSPGDFTSTESREIVAAARSRHASAQAWASVARPIRDPVRKAQRDALVAWHIANPPEGQTFDDAEDVYQYFLIDVSMNPEMLTSRIVQASCTVQLFIHRCLFGLESPICDWFNDEDRTEWEWMRTYRIWEAARKVFLYPENWIEPELRDDKTPLFTALERELSQGDVTADRVEQVTLDYLDRLHAVASLQVLACYVQKEDDADGSIDYLHVFARSYSNPPTYWYRRREDSATWTAWEKIDAGVQGDQLVPVIYNRRLMLFWGEFLATNSEAEGATPASWWEIRLAMSEYRDGKWSAKQVSVDPLSLQYDSSVNYSKADESHYGFCASEDADGVLTVSCFVYWGPSSARIFGQVGAFTLDPCTMQITVAAEYASAPRVALDPPIWEAPGFVTLEESGDTERTNSLDVYLGDADATGDPVGSATAVCVLSAPGAAVAVVPSQWNDFVSQSPFFVAIGKRTYFVEPQFPDDSGLAAEAASTTPSVMAVAAFRQGAIQTPLADPTAVLTDDYTNYYDPDSMSSQKDSQDRMNSVALDLAGVADSPLALGMACTYRFTNFYHPFVCRFVKELRREGIFGLLDPDPEGTAGDLFRQAIEGDAALSFENSYGPTSRVDPDYPIEDIDFDIDGAYSQYNWEIFFHLPFYLANRLADQGRFQDAFDYFHTMFDPRTRTAVSEAGIEGAVNNAKWWKVKPFLQAVSTPVTDWIVFTGTEDTSGQASFERQVAAWRADPFNPHLIARMRPGTYQRALVMRYVETLIAWGDELFTRDTIESLNEATQLYVFAKQVLGDKPVLLEDATKPTPQTYAQLAPSLDDFSNATVAIENAGFMAAGVGTDDSGTAVTTGVGSTTYFCVPFNMKLLSYWDIVDDRLFKIRNGMNISGVHRSLPLFQPPIDPAMLVRAAAAGIDIGSVANGTGGRGPYRFNVMLGRAQALAGSVKALGQALLGALEKRDAEALALLRQRHEGSLFDAMKGIKERSVDEAKENLAAAKKTKLMTQARHDYYEKLIVKGWLPAEQHSADLIDGALVLDTLSGSISDLTAILSYIPEIGAGFALHARLGGANVANSLSAVVSAMQSQSGIAKTLSGRLSTTATYKRRAEDWKQQKKLAAKELVQNDKQIAAAEIRVDIAKRELKNQELQIKQSGEVNDWMQRKYTNQELYDWMVSQLAALHFQSYQLALSTATKAQTCYNYELGRSDSFVQPVYWDSGKKGLLAGERLAADLERMDAAYLDNDTREFELTKHIALSRLDPLALAMLRKDGECYFAIPEVAFELDSPGHYFRRIQSVALSIAAITGQQGTVSAQLTLHGSDIRTSAIDGPDQPTAQDYSDYPSIVTSVATQDSGLFQADLKDPRYLPFERRGAISRWHLKLTARTIKQIDWDSITDVVVHMRYTARDNGPALALPLTDLLMGYGDNTFTPTDMSTVPVEDTYEGGAAFVLSAKRDDPDTLYAAQQGTGNSLALAVSASMLGTLADADADLDLAAVLVVSVGADATDHFTLSTGSGSWTCEQVPMGTLRAALFRPNPASLPPTTPIGTYTIGTFTSDGTAITIASLSDVVVILVLK